MQKRTGELFGKFQTGTPVPMSRDLLRDLGAAEAKRTKVAKAAIRNLRKQIIQAMGELPRDRALELLGEFAVSKHRLPPARDVDIGQFGGNLLARCSIEELQLLLRTVRPDRAVEGNLKPAQVRERQPPSRTRTASEAKSMSVRVRRKSVAKPTSVPVRATPETKAMRREMVALLRDEMPRGRALAILTKLAGVAKVPAPSPDADIGAFSGSFFAQGFTTRELVLVAETLGVPKSQLTKPRTKRASATQKRPKQRGSDASRRTRDSQKKVPAKKAPLSTVQGKRLLGVQVSAAESLTESGVRTTKAKAARKKRQKLIADINTEPSKDDAMNHRVPGSFESRQR